MLWAGLRWQLLVGATKAHQAEAISWSAVCLAVLLSRSQDKAASELFLLEFIMGC